MGCSASTPTSPSPATTAKTTPRGFEKNVGTTNKTTSKDSTAITIPDVNDTEDDIIIENDNNNNNKNQDDQIAAATKIQAFVRGSLCRIQVGIMVQSLIDGLIQEQQRMVFEALDAAEAQDTQNDLAETMATTAVAAATEAEEIEEEVVVVEEVVEEEVVEKEAVDTAETDEQQAVEEIVVAEKEEDDQEPLDEKEDPVETKDETDDNNNTSTEVEEETPPPPPQAKDEEPLPPPPPPSESYVSPEDQLLELERANDGKFPLWWMNHVPYKIDYDHDDDDNVESGIVVDTTGTDFGAARSLFS